MKNISLYVARLLSACCLYLFISKANVWLDKLDNTLLVFGYRFFILLAPFFFLFSQRWIGSIAFLLSTLGVLFWLAHLNILGTLLFTCGIAVGSYTIKYFAVKTPKGAAYNAIIFNLGVFIAGFLLILLPHGNDFLIFGLILMLLTLGSTFFINISNEHESEKNSTNFSLMKLQTLHGVAWAIVGLVSGIELIGMFSILPQYLISFYHSLPRWYGWIMPLSSLTVILLQHTVMNFMQHMNLRKSLLIMIASMVVTGLPGLFFCQYFIGAMCWVFVLTLFECAIIYFDTLSALDGGLLIKEVFVGLGMSVTVYVSRSMIPFHAAFILGCVGIVALLAAMFLLAQSDRIFFYSIKTVSNT